MAEATGPDADPDRRAWHRAHAAPWPDETVAAEMERSADRARTREGAAAAAAFLERAADLTPDPARRSMRAIAAAEAELDVGALDTAYRLLATAEMGQLDDLQLPLWSGFVRASRSPSHVAASFHRGCFTRPDASYPSTPDWRVRPTSMRSAQRSSPGGSTAAVLHNGLGRYDSAFAAGQRACEHDDLGLFGRALIELVEAGVKTGKPDTAAAAFWPLD